MTCASVQWCSSLHPSPKLHITNSPMCEAQYCTHTNPWFYFSFPFTFGQGQCATYRHKFFASSPILQNICFCLNSLVSYTQTQLGAMWGKRPLYHVRYIGEPLLRKLVMMTSYGNVKERGPMSHMENFPRFFVYNYALNIFGCSKIVFFQVLHIVSSSTKRDKVCTFNYSEFHVQTIVGDSQLAMAYGKYLAIITCIFVA